MLKGHWKLDIYNKKKETWWGYPLTIMVQRKRNARFGRKLGWERQPSQWINRWISSFRQVFIERTIFSELEAVSKSFYPEALILQVQRH